MSTIIVIEIIAAIGVLAAVVRFAVRDTRQRNLAESGEQSAPEVHAPGSEAQTEQPLTEVADQASP